MTDERKGLSKATLRGKRTKERMEMLRAAAHPGVRVVPANDDVRRVMKHPSRGGFPESGGSEWPNDRFTKRRLADGSVTREEAKQHDDKQPRKHQRSEPDNAA